MNLNDKLILLTGAAQGLGKALTEKLAQQGARLILIDQVSVTPMPSYTQAETYLCDIRNLSEVKDTIGQIIEKHQKIDILINNAGVWTDNELELKRPELRKQALETNALGHIQITEEVLPYMQRENSGYIFNVISTSGASDITSGDNSLWRSYGASKWAISGYTNALKLALKDTKIKVTGFFPGGFDSNLYENAGRDEAHEQPWMMRADDVADVVVFALTRPYDVMVESIIVSKKQ